MREGLFIKKNKDRWLQHQNQPPDAPDDVAKAFTQLVDDLGYAKTFYPSSTTTSYLNAQASKVYLSVYKNRKEEVGRITRFWKYDLPLTIYRHWKTAVFALIIFVLFFIIAFFISAQDAGMARSFFGDAYLKNTLENIRKGNPFGVYEQGNPLLSWFGIMINNIKVAFIFFISGLGLGIPTLYKLAETGAMVGIFDQLFASKGLGLEFWLVVFVHGTLELTAIVLAAAAGFILCKSFLFPGTFSRMDSFKQGAKDGVKIMVGLIPIFTIAAFFEGLFTRLYNDLPYLTACITTASVAFVVWYFILYPIKLNKRTYTAPDVVTP